MGDTPCLWVWILNIVKMSILSKLTYKFIIISAGFLIEIEKLVLKFVWKCKRPRKIKTTWNKHRVVGLTPSNFKNYKASVIKTVWYWHKDRHIDPCNGSENPEMFHIVWKILDKDADVNSMEKG